jgi:hypothetical protein
MERRAKGMEDAVKISLPVQGLGVLVIARDLSARAGRGDEQAERTLLKLRAAFEDARKLCRTVIESAEGHEAALFEDPPAAGIVDGDQIDMLLARAEKGDEAAEHELLKGREALNASIDHQLAGGEAIKELVTDLTWRARSGDHEAKRALTNLQEALEAASQLCEPAHVFREDELLVMYEGLLAILRAAQGRPEYPREVLQSIGEQTVELCKKLGFEPPDISFLKEGDE